MGSLKDKNLLFYSIHPKDEDSREFRAELEKNPLLKKQFIQVCVNDPNIVIPDKIRQIDKVPILIAAGFSRPIFGKSAVTWLKNGAYQDKANGFDFGALNDNDGHKYAYLEDELKPSDYNQFYNNDYNHGFTEKNSIINQQFAKLSDNSHITTYDDANELKKDISGQLEQRLSQLRQQRDTDIPRAVKRIGGMEDVQSQGGSSSGQSFMSGNRPGNGSGLAYNPNPFGSHGSQQGGPPQLPFTMPPMQQPPQSMQMQMPIAMPMLQMPQQMPQQMAQQMPYHAVGGPNLPFNMPGASSSQAPQLPFQMGMMNPMMAPQRR